ncbi:helix-turn-helix transcriptional regulator [Brevibacterium casei]|uniref:helix-turn-helix transcriptional regulator n=1 Tax=Brevibacterium casei TaxID=33889 RepID=UPI003700EB99
MHIPAYPQNPQTPHPLTTSPPQRIRPDEVDPRAARSSRPRELERLRTLMERHRAAAVVGRTGLGKSSLLREVEAEWPGPVRRVRFSHSEPGTDCSGIDILLTSLGAIDSRTSVADLARDRSQTVADAAQSALRDAGISDGALIVIAGADRMDGPSQAVLGQILRHAQSGCVSFAVSANSLPEDGPLSLVPTVELRELTRAELVAEARMRCDGRLSAEAAQLAAATACGRPHALRSIVAEMNRRERLGDGPLTIPVRLGETGESILREILGDPDPQTLTLLRLLSLAPTALWGPLSARIPGLWEIVDDLESRDVIERRGPHLRITHHLVRAWAHQSMGSSERIAGHEQLAADSAGVDSRLEHWHASFARPTEQTARALSDDGRTLIAEGSIAAGIEFVERAMRVSTDDESLAPALIDIARQLYERGEFVFASRYVRIAGQSGHPALAVRARTLGIRIAFVQRQTLPSHLINTWSKRERAEAPADVALLQLTLSMCRCERGEYAEAEELLREARGADDHLDEDGRRLLEAATIRLESARGQDRSALQSFAALRDHDGEDLDPEFVLAVASGLMLTEHFDSAQAALSLLRRSSGDGTIWRLQASCLQAETAVRAGRLRLADELIRAVAADSVTLPEVRPDRVLVLRAWTLLTRGAACDAEPVEAQLAALATTSENRRLLAELNALQGSCLLRMGCPAEAVRHLRRCDELSANEVNPNVRRHEADLIEALVEIGRREHAALLVQQLRKRVERCPSRWAELALRRGEALLASGDRGNELFNLALRSWGAQDSLYEKALTHSAFGRRLQQLGSESRAREQFLAAEAILTELGVERGVASSGPPAPPPAAAPALPQLAELSEEELKVVELVRAGLKNKDIARRVFVSLRTVELRLTAAYRKLGVGSRTELVSLLAGNPRLAAV